MRKFFLIALFVAAAGFLPDRAQAAVAAESDKFASAKTFAGRILIDAARHGEAWYVDPRSLQRVYLGRPHEALERLRRHATLVTFGNIERLAESDGLPADSEYAAAVAGYVLAPSDVVGASWYVDPALKIRLRLATPADAWLVMKMGLPVASRTLDGIAIEADPVRAPEGEYAVRQIRSADTLVLDDDSEVRLMSVDIPANPELQQAAMDRIDVLVLSAGGKVSLEADVRDTDETGTKLRFVRAGDIDLSYDLVRNGLAFHNIVSPNFRNAEMLIVGSIDAMNQKKGFWKQK